MAKKLTEYWVFEKRSLKFLILFVQTAQFLYRKVETRFHFMLVTLSSIDNSETFNMKLTRWLILSFASLSLFGVACSASEPETVEPEASEEMVEEEGMEEEMGEEMEEEEVE